MPVPYPSTLRKNSEIKYLLPACLSYYGGGGGGGGGGGEGGGGQYWWSTFFKLLRKCDTLFRTKDPHLPIGKLPLYHDPLIPEVNYIGGARCARRTLLWSLQQP